MAGTDGRRPLEHAAVLIEAVEPAARMRAEGETDAREAFLLTLSDALGPLADTEAIRLTAARVLGEYLEANRVAYAEDCGDGEHFDVTPNYVRGVREATGRHRYADYGSDLLSDLRAGRTRVQPDIQNDARLTEAEKAALAEYGVGASLNVPLVKERRLVAFLGVNFPSAHDFTANEIALVREVAERTWAAVERARAEVALRESEKRYRTLFEKMRQGYVEGELLRDATGKPVDYRLLEMNAVFEQLIEVKVADARGRFASEVLPELDRWWIEMFDDVVRSGVARRFEHEVSQLGRWYEVHAYATGGDRFTTLYDDITDRKHAEQVLRASEEQFRRTVEDAPIPVIMHAEDGEVLQISRTWSELTGYTLDDVPTFDAWFTRAYGEGADDVRAHVRALFFGSRRTMSIEFPVRTVDGQLRHWSFSASAPGRLLDGRRFVVGMALDVTERIRAEEALRSEELLRQSHEELEERVRERTAEVQALFRRLVSAQEEERRRIARDIHDQLGQQMTALRMHLASLAGRSATVEGLADVVRRAARLAEELDESIDFLTWQLRPATLDHLGLSAAVGHLVSGWSERFGIPADYQSFGADDLRLSPEAESNLYLLIQEALHNIVKHAHAAHASVVVGKQDSRLTIAIEDDGVGFDVPVGDRMTEGALGLISMRERATLVGGSFAIESARGRGTTILVNVPLQAQEQRA